MWNSRSTENRPNVSMRAAHMGVAFVTKLLPTSAVLDNSKLKSPIWVTPKDTFNDPTLDLTEKLSQGMKVAYKSRQSTGHQTYDVAIYVRPFNECISGEATMSEIKPTFGYAESSRYGSIFFPVSAIEELIVNKPYMRRCRDLSRCLRVGDPISFVAVADESTKNRSAYAVSVEIAFNKDAAKPMLGIITEVNRSTCDVWAKNFPPLEFNSDDFGVDAKTDFREIFTEGYRVTFQAASVGCGIGGVSNVQAVDEGPREKLERARAMKKKEAAEAGTSVAGLTRNLGTGFSTVGMASRFVSPINRSSDLSMNLAGATVGAFPNNITNASMEGYTKEIEETLRLVEDELDFDGFEKDENGVTDSLHKKPGSLGADLGLISSHCQIEEAVTVGGNAACTPAVLASGGGESKKTRTDAEVQVGNMIESEAIRKLLDDKEIFVLACQRYPELIHDLHAHNILRW